VLASRPGPSLPPEKTRYPLYRRLGGPQGRSGQVPKISRPPGFDTRAVQLVASHYIGYATRPLDSIGTKVNMRTYCILLIVDVEDRNLFVRCAIGNIWLVVSTAFHP
jgi:hypothetical protein